MNMYRKSVGIFLADEIFSKIRNNSSEGLLYRDFFRFAMEQKGLEHFKFSELANWLLDHNLHLRNEFADSRIPKAYRVHSKSSFIKTRLNEMVRARFIMEIGTTKAEKNNRDIPLYGFTLYGFSACLRLYEDIDEQKYDSIRSKHREIFLRLAKEELDSNYSVENRFYSKFIDKLYEQANFNDFITISRPFIEGYRLCAYTLFFPWMDHGAAFGFDNIMIGGNDLLTKTQISSIVTNTLDELDAETRELLLFQMKFGIEDYYYETCSTIEFEKLRRKNISDENKITIQTECSKCESRFPITVNIIDFIQRHSGTIEESHEFQCPECDVDGLNKSCKIITVRN